MKCPGIMILALLLLAATRLHAEPVADKDLAALWEVQGSRGPESTGERQVPFIAPLLWPAFSPPEFPATFPGSAGTRPAPGRAAMTGRARDADWLR